MFYAKKPKEKHLPGPPGELTDPSIPPAAKKNDVPIYFPDYPLIIIKIASYSLAEKHTRGYEFEVFSDFSKI